jgi:hypothetical protein
MSHLHEKSSLHQLVLSHRQGQGRVSRDVKGVNMARTTRNQWNPWKAKTMLIAALVTVDGAVCELHENQS